MRGFSGATTNLVVSLLVNLIIFSFFLRAPSLSPRLASLSRAPSPSFYPLVSYLPPHFSIAALRFPAIDPPLCVSAPEENADSSSVSLRVIIVIIYLVIAVAAERMYILYILAVVFPGIFPGSFAVLEPLDFCCDISPLSQLSLGSQRRPCPPTRLHLSTPSPCYKVDASWPVIHSAELCRGRVGSKV